MSTNLSIEPRIGGSLPTRQAEPAHAVVGGAPQPAVDADLRDGSTSQRSAARVRPTATTWVMAGLDAPQANGPTAGNGAPDGKKIRSALAAILAEAPKAVKVKGTDYYRFNSEMSNLRREAAWVAKDDPAIIGAFNAAVIRLQSTSLTTTGTGYQQTLGAPDLLEMPANASVDEKARIIRDELAACDAGLKTVLATRFNGKKQGALLAYHVGKMKNQIEELRAKNRNNATVTQLMSEFDASLHNYEKATIQIVYPDGTEGVSVLTGLPKAFKPQPRTAATDVAKLRTDIEAALAHARQLRAAGDRNCWPITMEMAKIRDRVVMATTTDESAGPLLARYNAAVITLATMGFNTNRVDGIEFMRPASRIDIPRGTTDAVRRDAILQGLGAISDALKTYMRAEELQEVGWAVRELRDDFAALNVPKAQWNELAKKYNATLVAVYRATDGALIHGSPLSESLPGEIGFL